MQTIRIAVCQAQTAENYHLATTYRRLPMACLKSVEQKLCPALNGHICEVLGAAMAHESCTCDPFSCAL